MICVQVNETRTKILKRSTYYVRVETVFLSRSNKQFRTWRRRPRRQPKNAWTRAVTRKAAQRLPVAFRDISVVRLSSLLAFAKRSPGRVDSKVICRGIRGSKLSGIPKILRFVSSCGSFSSVRSALILFIALTSDSNGRCRREAFWRRRQGFFVSACWELSQEAYASSCS